MGKQISDSSELKKLLACIKASVKPDQLSILGKKDNVMKKKV